MNGDLYVRTTSEKWNAETITPYDEFTYIKDGGEKIVKHHMKPTENTEILDDVWKESIGIPVDKIQVCMKIDGKFYEWMVLE